MVSPFLLWNDLARLGKAEAHARHVRAHDVAGAKTHELAAHALTCIIIIFLVVAHVNDIDVNAPACPQILHTLGIAVWSRRPSV